MPPPRSARLRADALELLLGGYTVTAAAARLGVARETVSRWRGDPQFAEELEERRNDSRDAVHDRLLARSVDLIDVLWDVATATVEELNDEGQPTGRTRPREGGMARVAAVKAAAELLGWHKGRPARPTERATAIESRDDVLELLMRMPEQLLLEALERRRTEREAS